MVFDIDCIESIFFLTFLLCFIGKFTIPEEFPVEQLYDIYMQKHALDDLALAIEFKVNREEYQMINFHFISLLEYSEF
jgi:hypothetical protein